MVSKGLICTILDYIPTRTDTKMEFEARDRSLTPKNAAMRIL